MTYNTRDARTSLWSSSTVTSERKTKYRPMIKRRSGSVDNFIPNSFFKENSGDEYFVPLVDESKPATYSSEYQDDASQTLYTSGDERLSPTLPLHRNELPANPQSPSDEYQSQYMKTPNHRKQRRYSTDHDSSPGSPSDPGSVLPLRRSLVFTAHKRKSTFSFAVTSFCLLGFLMYGNARSSLKVTVREIDDLVVFSEKLHRKLRNADHDMRLLEYKLTELDAQEARIQDEEIEFKILDQSSAFANAELNEEMKRQRENLKEAQLQVENLKTQMSEVSKQDAVDKYGGGDIRIKMDLIFPPTVSADGTSVADTGAHTIVMEMASLDIMPHSVYTFLEMVSKGLIDGCSFIINTEHVLKAAPLPYDKSSASAKVQQFVDAELESVAFKEYSPSFPHKKYTVGFAADGSPSFYINSEDNSDIHAGDPCFAKVVSGFDAVQRLDEQPTRNDIWFENRVGIKKVHIL